MSDEEKPYKRRVRYSGTHPKKFSEKYKELHPEQYAADIEKVKSRGQTPAGMHRPICVEEICEALEIQNGKKGLDCTLGYGGHSSEILKRISPDGFLLSIDVDSVELAKTCARIEKLGFSENVFKSMHMNFGDISQLKETYPEGFDFILADLGVSSMQLDTPERGFSYKNSAPLDLRLDTSSGLTAYEFLETTTEDYLANILIENSDEPYAKQIAKAIIKDKKIASTTDGLGSLIMKTLEKKGLKKDECKPSIQRVFQALRIEVNKEFEVLDRMLEALPLLLKAGGRVAILTFHSGEDRRVKKAFKHFTEIGIFSECVRRPIRPSSTEKHDNPRSTSAKLRFAIKS